MGAEPAHRLSPAETDAETRVRRRLRYSDEAANDLSAIAEWLTQPGSGPRALRRLEHIVGSIEALAESAARYPHDGLGHHEFSVEGHRVRYRIVPISSDPQRGEAVELLRIFGPGQDRP